MATSSPEQQSQRRTSTVWSGHARRAAARISSRRPASFDVVVVGAGIVGLTTAAARRPCGHAGGRRRGPRAGRRHDRTVHGQGHACSRARPHRRSCADTERGCCGTTSTPTGRAWTCCGRTCRTATCPGSSGTPGPTPPTSRPAIAVHAEAAALRSAGVEAELAATDELPFDTWGGVRVADQVQLDPAAYVGWLVRQAQQAGAQVTWPLRAHGGDAEGRRDGRGLRQPAAVGALGRPGDPAAVPAAHPDVRRGRAEPLLRDQRLGRPRRNRPQGMYLSVGDGPTRSLRTATDPAGREVLLIGGHGHPTGKALPASGHLHQLQQWGQQQFGPPGEQHRWSAQDYLSADLLPHIGAAHRVAPDRLLFACGFSKWGITNGTAAAIALVADMQGQAPAWAAPLRPRVPRGRATAVAPPQNQPRRRARPGPRLDPRPAQPQTTHPPRVTRRSAAPPAHTGRRQPHRRTTQGMQRRLHPHRRHRPLQRRGAVLGLPAARLPIHPRRNRPRRARRETPTARENSQPGRRCRAPRANLIGWFPRTPCRQLSALDQASLRLRLRWDRHVRPNLGDRDTYHSGRTGPASGSRHSPTSPEECYAVPGSRD